MKKYSSTLMLLIALIIIVSAAKSWKVFNYPPLSEHQWRQSDCAAYTKTYYRNGTGLFKPGTYYLGGKEGRVVSEFPLIYYIAAKIEKLTGEHYWVSRGLTFFCYVIGLFALLGCAKMWIPRSAYAIFPILLLASSPYYFFYAINFLPNIPALSFSFVGLYFFLRHEKEKLRLHLLLGTLFFMLATVLKPTDGGIIWLAYLLTWLCRKGFDKTSVEKWRAAGPMIASAVIIGVSILSWTIYVNWYNDHYGNHQNLVGIYPVWEMDKELLVYTVKRILTEWIHVFQQRIIIWFLFLGLVVFIFKWKYLDPFLRLFTAFLMLGVFIYAILWFKAFTVHDYYQLPYALPAVFLAVTVIEYYVRNVLPRLSFSSRRIVITIMGLLVIISIYHNRNVQFNRYHNVPSGINLTLFEMEPYLRSIGIKYTDAVVSVPDQAPNSSLNAINNYGYSEAFTNDTYNIRVFKSLGASYLIISDSSYLNLPLYKPFTGKQIGYYKGIYVFDIR